MITLQELGREIGSARSFVTAFRSESIMCNIKTNTLTPSRDMVLFWFSRNTCNLYSVPYGKFLCEAVDDVFTEWSCVPSCKGALVDGAPLSS